ncbi:MAG: DUF4349 domain-containing protein [Actinomycetota bacterium]|nr:DUF4349 domain-containing protein [Actinomycetota bacterium]
MARRTFGTALLAVLLLGTACGGDGSEDGGPGVSLDRPIGAPEEAAAADAVAKSAFAAMRVPRSDLDSATQEVVDLATGPEVAGFLVSSVFDTEVGHGSARVLVKVPSTAFEHVVAKLGGIGEVTRQELSGEDMNPELLQARDAVRRARDRTGTLISRLQATNDEALSFKLRQRLQASRTELRTAGRQASHLGSELAFSEVDVALTATPPPPLPKEPVVERALGTARAITLGIASGAILVAGVALPLLALLVLLFLLGGPIVRRLKPRLRSWPA